jgi:predicted DNA-binding protein
MKDSGLRIRVERELREKFLSLCREQDKPAAQVIREFMRRYIAENDDQHERAVTSVKKKKPA